MKELNIEYLYKKMTSKKNFNSSSYYKEYHGDRNIRFTQVGFRKDKILDNNNKQKLVRVSKIPFSFQKKIVRTSVSFLFGESVQRIPYNDNKSFSLLDKVWKENRIDNSLRIFSEKVQSETESAIVFFGKKNNKGEIEIKSRILSQENGSLYPYINEYGDMEAFGWEFQKDLYGSNSSMLYVFTDEFIYVYQKNKDKWELDVNQSYLNIFKKIPVVYLSQEYPEWWEVKDIIDRYEMTFSKFCDTNDYFASPMLMVKGSVDSLPSKDDTGKLLKLDIMETERGNVVGADVSYLTWDQAPEAIQLELNNSRSLIYSLTDTPDLSLENLKGIGGIPSGFALNMLFMGAIIKSKWKEGDYSTVVYRIINIIKSGLIFIYPEKQKELEELNINVRFSSILPKNLNEIISLLGESCGGKPIMSQKEAVRNNPLVEDPLRTLEEIEKESNQERIGDISNTYPMN